MSTTTFSPLLVSYTAALGSGDVDAVIDHFHEDAVYIDTALGVTHEGLPSIRRFLTDSVRTAGRRWLVDQAHETEEGFGLAWHIGGRHDADLPDHPATGYFFTIPGASMVRTDSGRIVRVRDFWNVFDLRRQLHLD
jgi:ketosteroid isomerase-like protein